MSWSPNPSIDVPASSPNGEGRSQNDEGNTNSNLQSLYYLLLNGGNLQDLVKQHQMLDTNRVCIFTHL